MGVSPSRCAIGVVPAARLVHLRRLTDAGGLCEHADGTVPRPDRGYRVDDAASALVVLSRDEAMHDDPTGLLHGWFLGRNDLNTPLYDAESGGCHNSLQSDGVTPDQGAEASIALISTLQHAGAISRAGRASPHVAPVHRDEGHGTSGDGVHSVTDLRTPPNEMESTR